MTQSTEAETTGIPGSAYFAPILGLLAIASFAVPPVPVVVGAAGLITALRTRAALRRDGATAGFGLTLIGAILSAIGIMTMVPWVIGVVVSALA